MTLGSAMTRGHHPLAAFRHAVWETWPIAGASVVPLAVLLVAELLGAELRTAAWVALSATVGLLGVYSYIAGVRGGLDTGGRILSALAGLALGLLVVLLKVGLH